MVKQRRMPVRTATVTLSGDYEGWTATVRLNVPLRALSDLESGDLARIQDGMRRIVLDWDFVDEHGKPLPSPQEGGILDCPTDLIEALLAAYKARMDEVTAVPKN